MASALYLFVAFSLLAISPAFCADQLVGVFTPWGKGTGTFSFGSFAATQPWQNSTTSLATYTGVAVAAMANNFAYDGALQNATFLMSNNNAEVYWLVELDATKGTVNANFSVTFGNYQGIQYDFSQKSLYTATLNTEFYWEVCQALEDGKIKLILQLPNTPTSILATAYSQTNHIIYLFSESLQPYGRMELQGVNVNTKAVSTNVVIKGAVIGSMFYLDSSSTLYAWINNAASGQATLVTVNLSTGNFSAPIVTVNGVAFQTAMAFSYSSNILYTVLRQPYPQNPVLVGVNLSTGQIASQVSTDWSIAGFAVVGSQP